MRKLLERYPYMMSKKQVADVVGVTRATVYGMIEDGRLKENGLGKIDTADVIKMIEGDYHRRRRPRAKSGS